MAVDITLPKATAPDPPEPARVSGWELFRWIYRFFYSKTVGLVLILAMAVLVLIGTLLSPQASKSVKADPELYQQFLDQWDEKLGAFGGLTGLIDGLGLFDVYRSPGFIVVCGLLAVSILACTAHRLPLLWRNWRHPRLVVPTRAYEAARYRAAVPVDGGGVEVMAQVRGVLAKQRYRVLTDPDHPKAVYADRFAWGGMGAVVSHLSFVIIIIAVVLSMTRSTNDMLLVPVGGEPVDAGLGSLSVAATSFEASFTDEGRPTDYVSHLVVTKNGKQVAEKDVRVNQPLRVGSVGFYQSQYSPGVMARVVGADGVLFDGYATSVGSSNGMTYSVVDFGEDQQLYVGVPSTSDPVTVTYAEDDWGACPTDLVTTDSGKSTCTFKVDPGQAVLELAKDTLLLDSAVVGPGGDLVVGNYTFTFVKEQYSPIIQIRQDPGEPLMWVGGILLIVGVTVVFACRHRRLWVTWDAESSRIRFASTDKSDTAWARRFRATVEAVAQEVDSAAHHGPGLGRTAGDHDEVDVPGRNEGEDR